MDNHRLEQTAYSGSSGGTFGVQFYRFNTMDYFWQFAIWILLIFTLLATIRLSFEGILSFPDNRVVRIISSPYWCFSLIILIGLVGEFGRNESSPLPWVAFANSYSRHGISVAIFALIGVVIVDLWLFWTPSQIYKTNTLKSKPVGFWSYIDRENANRNDLQEVVDVLESIHLENVKKSDKKKIIFARIINLLAGLLLVTPNNPVYSLLQYFAKHGSN